MNIDFTSGGYRGDSIEEHFKWFTAQHMPFWWHFREVLRASDRACAYWKNSDHTHLSNDEQKELIALSLLNYAVYTEIAGALAALEQLGTTLSITTEQQSSGSGMVPLYSTSATGTHSASGDRQLVDQDAESPGWQLFEVRRSWKAMYSCLYTSYNGLCNIVCVVVGQKPVLKKTAPVWNYGPNDALNLVKGRGLAALAGPLKRCKDRLEMRDHLDHYWLIWHSMAEGRLLMDESFEKGYVSTHPQTEVSLTIDAYERGQKDIDESARDFNLVYQDLAVSNGFLDQYLAAKGWKIDYADLGPPHNGHRPHP